MKLSVRKQDECYCPELCYDMHPYLNGYRQEDCVMANEEDGFCVVHQREDDGSLVLNPSKQFVETEILYGDVRFVWCVQ